MPPDADLLLAVAVSSDPFLALVFLVVAGGVTALCLLPVYRSRVRELRWLRSLAWPGADAELVRRLEVFRSGARAKVGWELVGWILVALWPSCFLLFVGLLCLAYAAGSTKRLRILAEGLGFEAGEWRGIARRQG